MTGSKAIGDANRTDDTDVLVVGNGIAGCSAALAAARDGASVFLVTKATRPENAATYRAQGGIAVTRDAPESLRTDVLRASANTANPDAIDVLVENANDAVHDVLIDTLGIPFDGNGDGFDYGTEAAHSEARILHVDASTGRHLLGPFCSHLHSHPRVTIREDTAVLSLLTHEGCVHGATLERDGETWETYAGATILATGGVGALYGTTTNPDSATGDGIAMAALAGAETADMAYVQFHPTAYAGADSFLVSEAVRGEGAVLRNADGDRFMPEYHPDAELAPRDIVARAVQRERDRTGEVTLDATPLDFSGRFPGLAEKCNDRGIPHDAIPVGPSEHFLCGGIAVDDRGRTTLDRLFAVGECARTGVHGANRLASTGLLEGLVWGLRAGEAAVGFDAESIESPTLLDSDPSLPSEFIENKFFRLRRVMDECVGLCRTPGDLRRAAATLRRLKGEIDAYVRTRTSRELYELRSASVVALLVARDALEAEPVGCHHVSEGRLEGEIRAD
ncbi:L-aspartate oxidase [Haladaptatus pallidirubidus]|uniref:L-aspartate oxidase n=1 Tax=Haladaptatus pallidirubidus TaxID=1008152 RepID=A0AAV3UEC3_9EURY|nr:FAD-dependent oxidoreductase [Haladaptatus pallidirubidus]